MFDVAQVPPKLIRYLGLGKDALSIDRVPQLWEKAVSLCQPATFDKEMDIEAFYTQFSPHSRNSKAINRLLEGSDTVVLLATSLGPELELASRTYRRQHQLFKGYMLDRMGSFMVESLMRHLDRQISLHYERLQRASTIRYSPGYQDFPLACQKRFIQFASCKIPYLKMDPDYRIIPEKSITAIKGVLPS